ncbi:hypothetical protein DL96DRAFT_1611438 [Flagelloscypha sp. PMI_526]|nr:hypothetical protein DL96DRAFT_1611438 [Flagelloscypha sp. PMI_526]
MHAQLGCLNLGFLDSMTVDYISSDLPSIQESGEFFERSSRLQILQVNFRELEPQDHISFFSVFRSRAVRILRLKLDHVLGLDDSSVLLSLLTCLTTSCLTQNFSALKEIHLDATSTDEEPCALSIESITFTAVRLASTADQTSSPLSVQLHIPASFIEPLSHTFESSEKLRVSSTPLDFDVIGVDSFMDGDLLLSHDRNMYPP